MRNPNNVLNSLKNHAIDSGYRYQKLYRNLFNQEFFLAAYRKIYAKEGNMTEGADGKTIDGMSLEVIDGLIQSLKSEEYKPVPCRRVYIPKKNGKQRPLGIPSVQDKLVQEVVRVLLESVYENSFTDTSHGFRPNRSCHTALAMIQKRYTGCKWFIEGDISGFFDNINHEVMIAILRKRIDDERFLRLIRKFLKAGYLEEWKFHHTYSGTPQGGIISPILANVYLDQFDKYMNDLKNEFDTGARRKPTAEYAKIANQKENLRKKLHRCTDPQRRQSLIEEIKQTHKELIKTQASDAMDCGFRRLQYVRYADDFLIGVIGSKADAMELKDKIARYLQSELHLELSMRKTLVTHGNDRARFLGYDVYMRKSNQPKKRKNSTMSRQFGSKIVLEVPKTLIRDKLLDYCAMETRVHNGKESWKPKARIFLKDHHDLEILDRYNGEIRGIRNFYSLANNSSWLHHFKYIMEFSMYKTFAAKYRTKKKRIIVKYRVDKGFGVKYTTSSGQERIRMLYDEGFTRLPPTPLQVIDEKPNKGIFWTRNTLADRLLARKCEWCGVEDVAIEMHHVRKLKNLSGKNHWERVMQGRRRKTMALCRDCHVKLHNGKLS
jgi:group II intron reverse transcriptase/maturase